MSRQLLLVLVTFSGACLWAGMTNELAPMMRDLKRLADVSTDDLKESGNTTLGGRSRTIIEVKDKNINTTRIISNENNTNATIVVHLHGEMGNHLSVLAQALAVQHLAREAHGIHATLVLGHSRGQPKRKWKSSRDNIQKCFSSFKFVNFTEANSDTFDELEASQNQQLKERNLTNLDDIEGVHKALSLWKTLLDTKELNASSGVDSVSIPFFSVSKFVKWDAIDKRLDEIKSFLAFDREACCRIIPDPDESVFVCNVKWLHFPIMHQWLKLFLSSDIYM